MVDLKNVGVPRLVHRGHKGFATRDNRQKIALKIFASKGAYLGILAVGNPRSREEEKKLDELTKLYEIKLVKPRKARTASVKQAGLQDPDVLIPLMELFCNHLDHARANPGSFMHLKPTKGAFAKWLKSQITDSKSDCYKFLDRHSPDLLEAGHLNSSGPSEKWILEQLRLFKKNHRIKPRK